MIELAIRLVFSLAVVLGLLLLLTKFGSRRFRGNRDSLVQVVHRQHLSRGTAVSVVTIGSRVLVLGTTEHQVRVLAELDPDEVADHLPGDSQGDGSDSPLDTVPGELTGDVLTLVPSTDAVIELPASRPAGAHRAAVPASRQSTAKGGRRAAPRGPEGALTGSVLSADTWRQALAAATGKAS
jgi:flagellar protein FliO/FliZ